MSDRRVTAITVNWYGAKLIESLIANLRQTAVEEVDFVVCDNTNGQDPEIRKLENDRVRVIPFDPGGSQMSVAHGLGLNHAFQCVQSPFCLTVDPDCRVLRTGWDQLCRKLVDDGPVAIGAPFPPWKLGKYHHFPGPHFNLFRTQTLRRAAADWRPYAASPFVNFRDFLGRQFLLAGRLYDHYLLRRDPHNHLVSKRWETLLGVVSRDTGWRVADNARQQDWQSHQFEAIRSVAELEQRTPTLEPRAALAALATESELYLWQGRPIVSHLNPTQAVFDVYLWSGKPLLQLRGRARETRLPIEKWESHCAAVLAVESETLANVRIDN